MHGTCCEGSTGHVVRAPWDMLQGFMGHVVGLRGTCCKGSMGHVARAARAPWDMLRGLHGTCCEGSMGHVVRAPWDMLRGLHAWDMLRGLHGTCCEGSMGYVARLHGTCCRAPWDMCSMGTRAGVDEWFDSELLLPQPTCKPLLCVHSGLLE